MQTTHYLSHMSMREVCPDHEATFEVCDCDCTCGGAGPFDSCASSPFCRLPIKQPRGYVRRRI